VARKATFDGTQVYSVRRLPGYVIGAEVIGDRQMKRNET
jgi:hypothetical protein